MTIKQILIKYWGYSSFRPMQEEIITSVLKGQDTLALLPTGGGKSICFQVPTMAKDGLCVVITPLVSLMTDQVEKLLQKGIKAVAIHSGMHRREIDITLDNCIYGNIKFLYVSPERLQNDLFRKRLAHMKVCLIAVDEAHCISQWGYDFRPLYLKIAEIKPVLGDVSVLALTATATPEVIEDIQEKLLFRKKNVISKSFERKNLAYIVQKEDDKLGRLLRVAKNIAGTGIVYARNRRGTVEISDFFIRNNISAAAYHAGMPVNKRQIAQEKWMKGKIRVMVATNAFGMGIDKPNVRFVVHLDLPDSIEAYFQEAGRAGRDEKRSWAALFYNDKDISDLKQNVLSSYPNLDEIKQVYHALGNYLQVAVGSGQDESYDFDLHQFTSAYNLPLPLVYNTLKLLQNEGYIFLSDSFYAPSKVLFSVNKEDLYRFQVQNVRYDHLIKVLLRSYGGIFTEFVKINEQEIANRAGISKDEVCKALAYLHTQNILVYDKQREKPQLVYVQPRYDVKDLYISSEYFKKRKEAAVKRAKEMEKYITSTTKCRSQILLGYFGEDVSHRCGVCDFCLEKKKMGINDAEFDYIVEQIKPVLAERTCTIRELSESLHMLNEEKLIEVVRWLIDNKKIIMEKENHLRWNTK